MKPRKVNVPQREATATKLTVELSAINATKEPTDIEKTDKGSDEKGTTDDELDDSVEKVTKTLDNIDSNRTEDPKETLDVTSKEEDSVESCNEKELSSVKPGNNADELSNRSEAPESGKAREKPHLTDTTKSKTFTSSWTPTDTKERKISRSKFFGGIPFETIIMTATITSTVVAAFSFVSMMSMWRDNQRMQEDLKQLQNQMAAINQRPSGKELDDNDYSRNIQIGDNFADEFHKTNQRLEATERKLGQCINITTNVEKEISETKNNLTGAIRKTKNEVLEKIRKDRNETEQYVSTNFMSFAQWFPIIGTGLIVELFLVGFGVYLYSKWTNKNIEHPNAPNGGVLHTRDGNALKTQNKPNGLDFQGMKWVLSNIKSKRLEDKICVVSFYVATSDKHKKLTNSALELNDALKGTDIVSVVINKHEELLHVPHCKIYIVFVDFNQRNVILEDTDKVIGDLKLTTARAIKKYNADLILVYVGYKGSLELGAEDLYNKDITSVQLHHELKSISQQNRFFSVHKEFSQYQKEHICQIVQNKLFPRL